LRSTRTERIQPIRSAITVVGKSGQAFNNSQLRASTSSTIDPEPARSYRGGDAARSAARTVFRDTPITRAIALIGIRSDRCNRRISAQSCTSNTSLSPWLG
jgi:hypothetical protein